MKKKLFCMVIILCLMIIIPFFALENKESFNINTKSKSKSEAYSKKDMYSFVSKEFKPEYSVETLKALTVILQSDYSFKEIKVIGKDDFLKKYGDMGEKYYKKIKNAVDVVYGETIIHNGENVYIPYCYVLSKSSDNSEYEYLKNVAIPWDCLNKSYKKSKSSEGISLNSLNTLCNNGYSYDEALNYFLKNTEIKSTAP